MAPMAAGELPSLKGSSAQVYKGGGFTQSNLHSWRQIDHVIMNLLHNKVSPLEVHCEVDTFIKKHDTVLPKPQPSSTVSKQAVQAK